MKIERIDDNSIRCTLSSLDLSSRNMNIRDMTYGSAAARKLFSEMMQKAQAEVGFEPDSTPLMIEAIPLQGGAVQLIISKVDDPEELDTRFSKFTQELIGQSGLLNQLANQILEGAQGLLQQIKTEKPTTVEEPAGQQEETPAEELRIFMFPELDRVCEAARALNGVYKGSNTLYKDTVGQRYYLVLHTDGADRESLTRAANLLAEYGQKVNGNELNEAYYQEHYERIAGDSAVQRLRKL